MKPLHFFFPALIATLLALLLPAISFGDDGSHALNENDSLTSRRRLTTVRGTGLANAVVANATGTSAVWHNPAAIADSMMYAIDAIYRYQHNDNTHGFQVNILDMKSNNYVGVQIGYMYEHSNLNGASQHYNHVRLGLGIPLATDIVSIGVTGAYEHIKCTGGNSSSSGAAPDAIENNRTGLSMGTMDVGLMIRPTKYLSIGFATTNLFVGDYKDLMPRMIATGIAFNSLELGLNVMFEASFNLSAAKIKNTGAFSVGLEYVLQNMFPLRLGYRYEMLGEIHVLSAGLAFRDSGGRFGLDLAYQHIFEPVNNNDIFQAGFSAYF